SLLGAPYGVSDFGRGSLAAHLNRPMSALGQKQTFAPHQPMSALPPKATSIAFFGIWDIDRIVPELKKETALAAVSPNLVKRFAQAAAAFAPAFRKASRSALIVSACVVIMPCGKPL